jgi:hypothetical protein
MYIVNKYYHHPELIENSQDREEIVETKDWIDELYNHIDDLHNRCGKMFMLENDEFREAVTKYAPKVTKVNQKEIDKRYY